MSDWIPGEIAEDTHLEAQYEDQYYEEEYWGDDRDPDFDEYFDDSDYWDEDYVNYQADRAAYMAFDE